MIRSILFSAAVMASSGLAQAQEVPARPAIERLPQVMVGGKPLPFVEGVRIGDILYLSGQIGLGDDGKLLQGIEAQARATMERITMALGTARLGWRDVFRCTVMLENMADWPAFNQVYVGYVDPAHLPARTSFGTDGLAFGALVEVQCDAHSPAD